MFWTFDRRARIRALVARCREAETYLRRSACDAPVHSPARCRLQGRLAVVRRRLARLSAEGRRARLEALATA